MKITLKKIAIAIFSFAFSVLALCFALATYYNIPFEKFTGDPSLLSKSNPLIGFVSNLGILFWTFSASVCFFSSFILLKHKKYTNGWFLLYSGVFTSLLLFDDLFMLHDYLVYFFTESSVLQYLIYTFYAVFSIWYMIKFYKIILKYPYLFLGLAYSCFALSILADIVFENTGIQYFIEDSLKFTGIISWSLFFGFTCYRMIKTEFKN